MYHFLDFLKTMNEGQAQHLMHYTEHKSESVHAYIWASRYIGRHLIPFTLSPLWKEAVHISQLFFRAHSKKPKTVHTFIRTHVQYVYI